MLYHLTAQRLFPLNKEARTIAAGQDVEYKNSKKQENESSPAGFVRGAAYYGGDDHAE